MNWDRIEGNWKQIKGTVKQQWGKLTDDQLDVIAGKRDMLAGKIQETYGLSKDEAEKQLSTWQKAVKDTEHSKSPTGCRRGSRDFDCRSGAPVQTGRGPNVNRNRIAAVALFVAGVVLGSGALGDGLTKEQYQQGRSAIASDYIAAKRACNGLAGNANDICKAEANSRERISTAELDARMKPSDQAALRVRMARVEGALSVARERCDARVGDARDACMRDAQAASVVATSEARSAMTTAIENRKASADATQGSAAAK